MGLEIKRVPKDFDWPVGKIWDGYLNPVYKHSRDCPFCEGSGLNPETKKNKKKCDEWEQTEPPEGEWWQLWETVSEGSPITPAFATADELVDHMCQPKESGRSIPWGTGYERASTEKWVKEIGWAPSMISSSAGVQDGVTAMGSRKDSP